MRLTGAYRTRSMAFLCSLTETLKPMIEVATPWIVTCVNVGLIYCDRAALTIMKVNKATATPSPA